MRKSIMRNGHLTTGLYIPPILPSLNDTDNSGSLALSDTEPNELAITFDRKDTGKIAVFLDGHPVANGTLPLLPSARIGNEIWLNSREWSNMDTKFRESTHRFSMYADAVPPEDLAKPCKPTKSCIQGMPNTD